MVVRKAWVLGRGTYSVGTTDQPFNPTLGAVVLMREQPKDLDFQSNNEGVQIDPAKEVRENRLIREFLTAASLANLATVHEVDDTGKWHARGDATEIAIQVFASRFDWNRLPLSTGSDARWKQLAEFPFDSDIKKMSVIFKNVESGISHVFTKGAVEKVMDACSSVAVKHDGYGEYEDVVAMSSNLRTQILENMETLARQGLRVLALASREGVREVGEHQDIDRAEFEDGMVFLGLIGLYDPPRPESAPSVRKCHEAGISVHMLTGDHPETARAIAREVGILPTRVDEVGIDVAKAMIMTASEFDKMSDDQIDDLPILPLVVARCAPQTKVRMIEALHRRGRFCAMASLVLYMLDKGHG